MQNSKCGSAGNAGNAEMHFLADWIAVAQNPREPVRERVDDRDFEGKPPVGDRGGESVALGEQRLGAGRELMQTIAQRRRRGGWPEGLDIGAPREDGVLTP